MKPPCGGGIVRYALPLWEVRDCPLACREACAVAGGARSRWRAGGNRVVRDRGSASGAASNVNR